MIINLLSDAIEMIIVVINTHVHILMYSYYFLSSFRALKKFTRQAKPILTAIQIVELLVIFGQSVVGVMPSCITSKVYYVHFINVSILISMYTNFFVQSYLIKNK